MNESALYDVIISIASNNQQEQHLREAQQRLAQVLTDLNYTDAIWTEPIGTTEGNAAASPLYLNQLLYAKSSQSAEQLNSQLKEIETKMGRTAEQRSKGIVSIDLDLMKHNGTRYHLKDWERDYVKRLLKK